MKMRDSIAPVLMGAELRRIRVKYGQDHIFMRA
jgi:hypothetical protein